MAYTEQQITAIMRRARDAGLEIPQKMLNATPADLTQICNGVGSEAMPAKWRAATSKFFCAIEATAAIHDWDYSRSDGSESRRQYADDRFLVNGIKEIYSRYKWYNWRRYVARVKLMLAYDTLLTAGRSAWLECYYNNITAKSKKNKNNEK